MNLENIKQDIIEKNYSQILFPLSHKELSAAAETFLEFLTLSQDYKEKFYTRINPDDPGSHVGYVHRSKANGKDDKEFFHYHECAEEVFKDLLSENNFVVQNFFESARRVYKESVKTLEELLKEFEKEFPGIHGKFFPKHKVKNFYLRFLKYNSKEQGDFLARGHYDRGGLTLALAESAPGLRIGKNGKLLQEVIHKEKHAIFMPAYHFKKITNNSFMPTWHDVVQSKEDKYSEGISRWAIVFFCDAQGMDMQTPTEKEAHTPLA